jgi:hypothetical protein
MMGEDGIKGLIIQRQSLEDRIEAHLAKVPADDELKHNYVNRSDREKVRRRALIAALLDAVFEHDCSKVGVVVEVGTKPDIWSDLADARRDFQHDCDLLDAGHKAQLILQPTKTDTSLADSLVSAKVKELILWLAVIHLHQAGLDTKFPTQQSVIANAAKATGRKPGSILTELSRYTTQKGPSEVHLGHFWELVEMAQTLAQQAGNDKGAFALLLPAALAISKSAISNETAAGRMT